MTRPPTLATNDMTLRPLALRDAPFVLGLVSDARMRRYLGGVVPVRQRLGQVAGYYRPGDGLVWVVRQRPGQRRAGMVFLALHRDGADWEMSYQFAPAVWGRGVATAACAAVLAHARDTGLPRVIAETQAANAASCRLLARLGMRETGRVVRFGAEQVLYAT